MILTVVLMMNAAMATPQMLTPGVFHGDEISASVTTSSGWLALRTAETGGELAPIEPLIRPTRDAVLDAADQMTGIEVRAEGSVLLTGLGLEPGPVTSHLTTERALPVGDITTVWADGLSVSVLAAVGEDGMMGEDFLDESDPTYQLVLHSFPANDDDLRESQLLFAAPRIEKLPRVLWTGDLDRDGQVDLLIETSTRVNVSERVLYLSTAAEEGELVGEAARFRTTGC